MGGVAAAGLVYLAWQAWESAHPSMPSEVGTWYSNGAWTFVVGPQYGSVTSDSINLSAWGCGTTNWNGASTPTYGLSMAKPGLSKNGSWVMPLIQTAFTCFAGQAGIPSPALNPNYPNAAAWVNGVGADTAREGVGDIVQGLPDEGDLNDHGITMNPPFEEGAANPPGDITNPDVPAPSEAPTQGVFGGLFGWLANQIRGFFLWLGDLVNAVKDAIVALPDAIAESISDALEELFIPDAATQTAIATQVASLKASMETRLPFSLLNIDLPTVGSGSCPPTGLSIEFPVAGELDPFDLTGACTVVATVRGFLLGAMWFGLALWLRDKVWPQVHI
jgi:hypothetical protein